jgi:hypothetical protein
MNDSLIIIIALLSLIIFVVYPILNFGLKLFLEIIGLVIILVLLFAYGIAAVGFVLLVCLIALPFVLVYRYFFDD